MSNEINKKVGFFQIGTTMRGIAKLLEKRLGESQLDMTIEQFGLLKLLSENDEFIQSELASLMAKHKSAVMRHIDVLESKKWVARINDSEDRRKKLLVLTRTGDENLKKATAISDELMDELTADIDEKDMSTFRKVLNDVGGESQIKKISLIS